ncbi:MAG: flippase-like domain-containing protein [Planctomycetes bacterium]|nr:flippase-like domain-containing protein [Planctomycetota bacterium]
MKSLAFNLLKLLVAGLLVWYVLTHIEWRDTLEQPGEGQAAASVLHAGSLEGDWRGDAWSFTAEDGDGRWTAATLPAGWKLRPGFLTLVRGMDLGLFALSVGLWALLLVVVGYRWKLLLAAAGVPTGYGRAMRLCFIGYFFNNVMPGLTGGDLVRAVMVTRGLEEHRARAAMSVLVDRLIGLFGLLALGAAVLVFVDFSQRVAPGRLAQVRWAVMLVLLGGLVGVRAYLSPTLRRVFRLDALLRRLPMADKFQRLDDALLVYRGHRGAVAASFLLSVVLQAAGVLSFWTMGQALGAGLGLADNFAVYPVVQTISSVPVAPAGWGYGDFLFGKFFQGFGSTFTLGVAVSVIFRLTTQLGVGLIGGLVWVLTRERGATDPLDRSKQA